MADRMKIEPDLEFVRRIREVGGEDVKKCYQCATCSVVCELSPDERPFPRKEMLWAQWGLKDRLVTDPDVWLCHQCNDCSTRCPRGARPGDVLAAVRTYVYENFSFPRFMGRAMSSPNALPWLFLLPMVILTGLIWINMQVNGFSLNYFLSANMAELTTFIPAGYTEMFFIGGNILIFAIAFVGLKRFWNTLQHDSVGEPRIGFVTACWETLKEIAVHKHFAGCVENRPRRISHLLVFYGFLGAAATAGLALVFGEIFGEVLRLPIGIDLPIDFWLYDTTLRIAIGFLIKLLGAGSGMAILIGGVMMMNRRNDPEADVGADAYPDRLFLNLVVLVGVTGLLSWLLRLFTGALDGPAFGNLVAYLMYYMHIALVFVLLWYMPYSKFAHMFYRTMALVWARQRGRVIPETSGNAETTAETVSEVA